MPLPLHIDIRINDDLIRRLHISRMTSSGMKPDSVNEYSVVVAEKETVFHGDTSRKEFKACPDWWEWEVSEIRFFHRYGDDELTCLLKAVEAVKRREEITLVAALKASSKPT